MRPQRRKHAFCHEGAVMSQYYRNEVAGRYVRDPTMPYILQKKNESSHAFLILYVCLYIHIIEKIAIVYMSVGEGRY